jgi:peptidoglycan hydrolase-like protein with peptidoglycan-binding domain
MAGPYLLAALLILGAGMAQGQTAPNPAPKKAAAPAAKAPAKKPAATPAKKTTRKRVVSGPPRQTGPTAERYRQIQQALIDKGYLQGSATGAWGADSVAALRQFQADQKLEASGKINALTLIRLGLGPKRDPVVQNGQLPEAGPKAEP